jgi:hypothetical protein
MPKFKLLVKRTDEYTMIINVEAPDLSRAIDSVEEQAYDDLFGDMLDKGYNQCYYEVTEVTP